MVRTIPVMPGRVRVVPKPAKAPNKKKRLVNKAKSAVIPGFLKSVEKKLSNDRFVQNAKPEIVANERQKAADAETKLKSIEDQLVRLKG